MNSKIDFVRTDLDDLSCHTATTFEINVRLIDNCTGVPDNLTGYTARMVIYDTSEISPISTISGTISTPTNGIINFLIPATTTDDYIEGMYNHYIEILISGRVDRIGYGYFEVTK